MSEPIDRAERLVLESWIRGDVPADLTVLPAEERRLSAARIRELLSGPVESVLARSATRDGGSRPNWIAGSLRIIGAHIEGVFRMPLFDAALTGRASLWFAECSFDAPIDLCGAEVLSVRLVSCRLPAFLGASLEVAADLDLSGSEVLGIEGKASELADIGACSVCLTGARIGGRLRLAARGARRFDAYRTIQLEGAQVRGGLSFDGARVNGAGECAIDARAMQVGGSIRMRPVNGSVFEARGEIVLSAAQVTGDLELNGAWLHNPDGRALHCEDLRVESVVMSAQDEIPFRAAGRLNFLSAVVGGNFLLAGARISPGPDYPGRVARGAPVALNLQQLRVSNALMLADVGALDRDRPDAQRLDSREPLRAWFLLSGAHVRTLLDAADAWPAAGFVLLEGLTYERISESGGGPRIRDRIEWLRLQFIDGCPTAETFRPQPYEQLVRALRAQGRREEADRIAIEQVRMRLAARVDDRLSRIVPRLLMWVSLHGYSSARALTAFALFIVLGSLLYGLALWGFDQPFLPVEHDPVPTEYQALFGSLSTRHAEGCPALFVPFFALDSAMPIVDVGQSSTCRFAPVGEWRWLWLLLHSGYSIVGAALSAIVVLTLSGLMRRDRA